jgi:hypothetical protein
VAWKRVAGKGCCGSRGVRKGSLVSRQPAEPTETHAGGVQNRPLDCCERLRINSDKSTEIEIHMVAYLGRVAGFIQRSLLVSIRRTIYYDVSFKH